MAKEGKLTVLERGGQTGELSPYDHSRHKNVKCNTLGVVHNINVHISKNQTVIAKP